MLYILPTPIGNLGDITIRSLETLKTVPLVIAENPLHTKKLLDHYDITGKELAQFSEPNELRALPKLIEKLQTTDACLVSDAGTPAISDPGFRLVRACLEHNIKVISLPGASASITAMAGSGLPSDKFFFVGFLPKTEPKVLQLLAESLAISATLVAYDSPQRILKTVGFIAQAHPEAKVVVARELSKLHEEYLRGTATEVLEQLKHKPSIKGEITLLVSLK
jgi:16S rRNA (cytidine1402-2'-O)-methyltransferase